jgi:hypothetical protein
VQLSIEGDCLKTVSMLVPDNGLLTTPALRSQVGHELESCPIAITLDRSRAFGVNSAYQSGYAQAHSRIGTGAEFHGIAAN